MNPQTPLSCPKIFYKQDLHFISLLILLAITAIFWLYLEKPSPQLFGLAVAFPIFHQIFVWLTWRIELRTAAVSKTIGFSLYFVLFSVLFAGRFISLFALAIQDRGSLPLPVPAQILLTTTLAAIGIYAMYSVLRYFGMKRAAGADHFDSKYRNLDLVKQGIFRFTNNGMYLFAFFLFWAIAIAFNSAAALLVTGFSHAYIWVHFYCTEKPDMEFIYSKRKCLL